MGKMRIVFTQINLHYSKDASAVLVRRLSAMHTAIFLIQKPWIVRDGIRRLARCGRLYKAPGELRSRACIAVKDIDAEMLSTYCSRNVMSMKLKIIGEADREKRIIVCSAYLDGIGTLLPHPMEGLVQYCQEKRLPLIVWFGAIQMRII